MCQPTKTLRELKMDGYNLDVRDKVAIVTGGSQGIGSTISAALVQCGARVVAADIEIPRRSAPSDSSVMFLQTDVTDPESVAQTIQETVKVFGGIDILVNNAGIIYKSPIEDLDLGSWKRVVDVNLTGPVIVTKAVVPELKKRKWGRIVNLSSMQALIGTPTYSAYSATKAGLSELTRVWAAELAPFGITVNAICPSYVETPMMERSLEQLSLERGISKEEALEYFLQPIPQKRLLKPQEIAFIVLFLCSPLAAGITGHDLVVAAGMVMH
jgi:NAD(P)-dependent dehydrogenase (short-subunit alcohol dehydrogenase family)